MHCLQFKSEFIETQGKGSRTMMLWTLICPLLAYYSSKVLAKPVEVVNAQTLQSDLGDLRLPSDPSNMLSTPNATLSLVNTSVPNEISIKCDGGQYGFKPDVDDCTSALRHQLMGRAQIKFGQRGSFSSEKYVSLPYRLMGGT